MVSLVALATLPGNSVVSSSLPFFLLLFVGKISNWLALIFIYLLMHFIWYNEYSDLAVFNCLWYILATTIFFTAVKIKKAPSRQLLRILLFISFIGWLINSIYTNGGTIGSSGWPYNITNDISLQIFTIAWAFVNLYGANKESVVYLSMSLVVSYFNHAQILMISHLALLYIVFGVNKHYLGRLHTVVSRGMLLLLIGFLLYLCARYFPLLASAAYGELACGSPCFRLWTWFSSILQFLESPIFGHGPGYSMEWLIQGKGENHLIMSGSIHNLFLQMAVDLGAVFFALCFFGIRGAGLSIDYKFLSVFIIALTAVGPSIFSIGLVIFLSRWVFLKEKVIKYNPRYALHV